MTLTVKCQGNITNTSTNKYSLICDYSIQDLSLKLDKFRADNNEVNNAGKKNKKKTALSSLHSHIHQLHMDFEMLLLIKTVAT